MQASVGWKLNIDCSLILVFKGLYFLESHMLKQVKVIGSNPQGCVNVMGHK